MGLIGLILEWDNGNKLSCSFISPTNPYSIYNKHNLEVFGGVLHSPFNSTVPATSYMGH